MDPSLRQKGGRLHIDTKLKAPSLTLPESQSSHEHSRGKDSRRVPHTKVYFHVACSTAFGEYVRVVGDHASLGNWQTKQGVRLETNDDIYPVYISPNPIFVELHARVQYRYVLCGPDDEPREWQASEATRSFIATGTEMTMEDDDGVFRQKAGFNEEDSDDEFDEPYHTKSQLVKNMDTDQKRSFLKEVLEGQIEIGARDTIFMLAFQLPVKVFKDSDGAWRLSEKAPNDGRNFAFLPLLQEVKEKKKLKVVNVGWPGVHPENDRERREIERLLAPHDFVPVFPPRSEFEGFLNFCRTFLWPVLHDSMQFFQSAKSEPFNEQGWAAYQHINNIYALAVVPHTHENDLIFIQDYHMLMTPTFIARKIHKANIGFYLHAPFPSSDSFKTLPVREEILAGMLSADQLGFQFFSYARNFLVSCKRVYGLDPTFRTGGFTGLEYNGRTVMIKVAHFAYPYQASIKVVNSEEVQKGTLKIKRLFEGKTIFACMDRADGLSALIPKFQAFRQFLKEKPEYQGKIILVQYCFDSLGVKDAGTAAQLRAEADALLKVAADGQIEIATKEGVSPDSCSIFLRFEKIERTDRLALFRAADVLLDTSAKNGLNLMPFEFVAAHHDMNDNKACIVSEFSGCSRVLLGSLRANPWNNSALCSIMERALTMPEEEKKDRFESNLQYVSQNSPMVWFEDFLTDLKRARKKDDVRIESIGFGAKIRQVAIGTNFEKLSSEGVLHAFRQAQKRVFFFDNEGTLAADKRHMYRHYGAHMGDLTDLQSRGSAPNQQVMDCLQSLCSDIRNTVVILSGRNREMMEQWFGKVPRLGLAAERGFFYKLPFNTGGQWHCMVQKPDYTWKSFAFEIMRNFVKRTQGSFIENKGSALVWQYRDADPHFGSWQAKELSSHLKELLIGYDLEILEGKGYVEVKVSGVNKGVAVAKALTKVSQTFGEVDFILCIGDDRSDEDMFEVVNQMLDPTDELETPSQISQDESSENESVSRLKAKSEVLLPKRQSSGKLGGLGGGGGLCGYSGDLRGSLSGGLDSLGGESSTPQSTRRFFTCTVGRKPSAAKFFLDDTEEVSELLASLRQVQEKQAKVPYPAAKYDSFTR
ncbi:TPS6 [Symbiodinium natans]|uniref:TPS6 protein n=1 Tax=Symbiodinium natans TaxID=878477 RepID=A0A812MID8_9DINO|nr:TPS6 [Symbiodinium natans]